MSTMQIQNTVGELVTRHPKLSRVFEELGIDYCCGGKKTLEEVCAKKGLDSGSLLVQLEKSAASVDASPVDAASMSLTDLADHIEQTHHAYLKAELPRLDRMTEKVATVHGEKEQRLAEIRETFVALANELSSHMMKEERVLFPMVRQLEASTGKPSFHCGSLAHPIRQMESEHDFVGSGLEKLNTLTGGYTPPDWACNTYRAMLDGLHQFERDLHQHIHKENNVLFPRALDMELRKGG